MLGRTDSRRRLLFLLVLFIAGCGALLARTAYWQVAEASTLAARAQPQISVTMEIPSRRGEVYDRTGVVLLATTVDRDRLVAATDNLTSERRDLTGDTLVRILALDEAGEADVRTKLASGDQYVILARGLTPDVSDEIRASLDKQRAYGLALEPEPIRVYPQPGGGPETTLASHLLGFVNREGQGQYGVEARYHDLLAGAPRLLEARRDINGRAMADTAVVTSPGVMGQDLRLTIDAGLQLSVEEELLAAGLADVAKSVSAVVMDPYTGEIYAQATYPAYDGNEYREVAATDPGRFVDPIVSSLYEPGSVLKMMTAATALTAGTVDPLTRIKDVGTLKLDDGRTKIDNADRKGMGTVTFQDGIAYSRNVVAAKVALDLGDSTGESAAMLYDTWRALGLGQLTGIDVAGEIAGAAYVRDPAISPWREIDLANASFGQGVAVTPIQLATAYAALLNGGTLVQPHVVASVGTEDIVTASRGQVVEPSVSRQLVDLADRVVNEVPFYRDRTLVKGYYVGGKTGTAQIWDAEIGNWKHNLFNYSFVGYIGREASRPDLIVAVRIEEGKPTVARVGQLEMPVMSFELFRRIATNAIKTPDLLRGRDAAQPSTAPDPTIVSDR